MASGPLDGFSLIEDRSVISLRIDAGSLSSPISLEGRWPNYLPAVTAEYLRKLPVIHGREGTLFPSQVLEYLARRAGREMKSARPGSAPEFFQACARPRGMNP